jgi:CRISPR-associated protein Cas5h
MDDTQNGSVPSPDLVGRRCTSFEVRGPWAHFRRIEGNIVKQTYRIPPRTTIAGLAAAIVGVGRDEYYDTFQPGRSALAIEALDPLRTMNLPTNSLATANEDMMKLNSRGKVSVQVPRTDEPRKQHNYEVLVDPRYRVDLWTEDDFQDRLRAQLDAGRSHYVPSLGLSEHLAEVNYLGEYEVAPGPGGNAVEVDSALYDAVDDVLPQTGTRHELERSPAHMETVPRSEGGGRRSTGFVSVAYSPSADPLRVADPDAHRVDDRTVVFC